MKKLKKLFSTKKDLFKLFFFVALAFAFTFSLSHFFPSLMASSDDDHDATPPTIALTQIPSETTKATVFLVSGRAEDNEALDRIEYKVAGNNPSDWDTALEAGGISSLDWSYVLKDPLIGGPIEVNAGKPVLVSQRVHYRNSINEVTAFAQEKLSAEYYFPWYDSTAGFRNWVLVANPPTSTQTAQVKVSVAGSSKSLPVKPGDTEYTTFDNLKGGLVKVESTNGVPIFCTQRVTYGDSFNETGGVAKEDLAKTYYFPWYDCEGMSTWFMVGNPSPAATATVDIYIQNGLKERLTVAPSRTEYRLFSNVLAGPVKITSTEPVVVSERIFFNQSFNEVMAVPESDVGNRYFVWYDEASLGMRANWVLVANPFSRPSAVQIKIKGNIVDSKTVSPNEVWYPRFPGVIDGPVEVVSSEPVICSQRIHFRLDAYPTESMNEVMGVPPKNLSKTSYFPWYDFSSEGMEGNWVLVSNFSDALTNVAVKVAGEERGSERVRPNTTWHQQISELAGKNTFSFKAVDEEENESPPASFTTSVDAAWPETECDLPEPTAGGFYTELPRLTLNATDTGSGSGGYSYTSGLSAIFYQIDGGELKKYNPAAKPQISEGAHTICYFSQDKVRNFEPEQEATITVFLLNPPLSEIPSKMGLEPYWTYYSEKMANGNASVNLENGNLVFSVQDVGIPGQGLDTDLLRTYNSQVASRSLAGSMGYGWSLNMPQLYQESTTRVVFLDEDQTKHTFTLASTEGTTQTFNPPAGIFSRLVKAGGEFSLVEKDQTKYTFDATSGAIQSITDPNDCDLTFDYGETTITVGDESSRTTTLFFSGGRLSRIEDAADKVFTYTYDTACNLTQVTDTSGNAVSYAYDSSHKLISVKVLDPLTGDKEYHLAYTGNKLTALCTPENWPDHPTRLAYAALSSTVADPREFSTVYQYNSSGNPQRTTDASGNAASFVYTTNLLQEKTDPRGVKTKYTYDSTGNVTSEVTLSSDSTTLTASSYAYDGNNNLLASTDPNGQTQTNTYDAQGNQLSENSTLITPTGTIPINTSMGYDAKGNQTTETDPNGHTTEYGYNQHGYETQVTDPGGFVSTSGYDKAGNLASEQDPNNNATAYSYDPQGNLLKTTDALGNATSYTYDSLGNKLSETLPNNAETRYAYDQDGRLTETASPAGTTKYEYDASANLKTTIDGNGNATGYSYDGLNRLMVVHEPTGGMTSYGYDSVGNRTQVAIPNGGAYRYTYNELNQMTAEVDPEQNKTEYGYDAMGNKLAEKNPEGNETKYTYDSLNRLVAVTDPYGKTISYGYDKVGNLTSQTDALGNTTRYEYDANDNLAREIDPLGKTIEYTYDGVGNLLSKTDCSGTTTYTYDALNRQTGVTYPDGSTVSYTYDSVGNKTSMTDQTGTTTYQHDLAGRLISSTDPQGVVTTYEYDGAGNVIKKTVSGLVYLYTYDASNRLVSQTDPCGNTTYYSYDLCGNVTQRKYPNQIVTAYGYDKANRLTALSITNGLGETLVSYTYEYDKNGNRTKIVDSTIGTYEYKYDSKDQLVYVLEPVKGFANPDQTVYERLIEYTYDENGNRLGKQLSVFFEGHRDSGKHLGINAIIEAVITQGNLKGEKKGIERNILEILNHVINDEPMVHGEKVGLMRLVLQVIDGCTFENGQGNEYQYNAANQLTKFYDPVQEAWVTFTYDANGNLKTESCAVTTDAVNNCNGTTVTDTATDTVTYSWDAENRLTQITKPDGTQVSYSYDGQGRRVSKTVSANNQHLTTNNYSYDNSWRVMKEVRSEQGGENREIQYNYHNEDTPISITYAGNTYFYLTNGHGDITGLSDSSGAVIARYAYDTWGRPIDTWSDETTIAAKLLELNPYQYASYRFDDETSFYYLRNRYYDPRTGRFISKDKFKGFQDKPQTLNPYTYCENNPISKVDPSGLWGPYVHYTKTVEWAGNMGFTGRDPGHIAYWNEQTDYIFKPFGKARWKYHYAKFGARKTARKNLRQAIQMKKRGDVWGSHRKLGIALHCVQDIICHGRIRPKEHQPWKDDWNDSRNADLRRPTEIMTKVYLDFYLSNHVP